MPSPDDCGTAQKILHSPGYPVLCVGHAATSLRCCFPGGRTRQSETNWSVLVGGSPCAAPLHAEETLTSVAIEGYSL